MALLKNGLVGLRSDPRLLLKLPPYLSLVCILVGLLWLLVLPLNQYSRHTYISENALLPGQVSTYFGGSEHEIFRAYRHEVASLHGLPGSFIAEKLGEIFQSQGLKVARQNYRYESAGQSIDGHNVYAVLQGPRADATEAVVLAAAWENMDGIPNQSGVALVLSLARYFNRWSLWSKDIIFVITGDSVAGPQAWVDAYHSTHNPSMVEDLPIKSGTLQGALALDYTAGTGGHRFGKIHIVYDGINGQLPNLDLFNSAVHISADFQGMPCTIQRMWNHADTYKDRLQTIFRSILAQGLGHASGPHSAFIPYHIDAITLQTVGDGWHDEMTLGRLVESLFRSLNNLLEHFHQSFFLYLLMHAERFVSIATYLPSAMLIAVNFSIMSIALWVRSGRAVSPLKQLTAAESTTKTTKQPETELLEKDGLVAIIPKAASDVSNRAIFFSIAFMGTVHLLGLAPLYLFNSMPQRLLGPIYYSIAVLANILPYCVGYMLQKQHKPSFHTLTLISCFSLLILGTALATLSTLNYALGLLIGLLASPLSFVLPITSQEGVPPSPSTPVAITNRRKGLFSTLYMVILHIFSPTTLIFVLAQFSAGGKLNTASGPVGSVLAAAAQAWHVSGTWTSVVVWLVWWPAWLSGVTVAACEVIWAPDSRTGFPESRERSSVSSSTVPMSKANGGGIRATSASAR